jgi:hypothetical protein
MASSRTTATVLFLFLASLCAAQFDSKESEGLNSNRPPGADSEVKKEFTSVYESVVRNAIRANLSNNTATSAEFWSNSRDFCFSKKPSRPTDAEALKISTAPDITRVSAPRGVSAKLPYYQADTDSGKAQILRMREVMAAMAAKSKATPDEVVQMIDAALPFMRTVEAGALAKGVVLTIPPKSSMAYVYTPHCLQVDAPAVGLQPENRVHKMVGHNRPVLFYPSSVLIPKEAQELYASILSYESTHPEARALVHSLLWGIRGADLKPPPINPTPAQIKLLNEALPDGAKKYLAYVELAQHPERKQAGGGEPVSPGGLLTIDSTNADLLRHHLDTVTINHGTDNPFNPADTEAILKRLTNPGPLPVIETEPTDQTVQAGTKATFTAKVTGDALKFQWRFNDKDLPKATDVSLSVEAGPSTIGLYQLVVTSGAVTVKSQLVRLKLATGTTVVVRPAPADSAKTRPAPKPASKDFGAGDETLNSNQSPSGFGQSGSQSPFSSGTATDDPFNSGPAPVLGPIGVKAPAPTPARGVANKPSPQDEPVTASLVGPSLAARGTQEGLTTGKATITNSGDRPASFRPNDFIVATTEPSQPSSISPSGLSIPDGLSEKSITEATQHVEEFVKNVQELANKGVFSSALSGIDPVSRSFWSAVLKTAVRSTPIIGSGISLWEAAMGVDAFDNSKLSPLDRVAAGVSSVAGLVGLGGGAQAAWKILRAASNDRRVLNALVTGTRTGVQKADAFSSLKIIGTNLELGNTIDMGFAAAKLAEAASEVGENARAGTLGKTVDTVRDVGLDLTLGKQVDALLTESLLKRLKVKG